MAIKYEGSFLSEADTLEISVLCLMPEPGIKPRAIVQLVHGMSEHKERYIPFMEYLTDKGYITVIHDHRGHGKSVLDTALRDFLITNSGLLALTLVLAGTDSVINVLPPMIVFSPTTVSPPSTDALE